MSSKDGLRGWTETDVAKHQAKVRGQNAVLLPTLVPHKKLAIWSVTAASHDPTLEVKRNKFHDQPTVSNSIRFASKGEAALYERLCMMQSAGQIAYFLRQVPFHLPGNIVYRCDFAVFYSGYPQGYDDGVVRYLDFKGGPLHPIFVLKRKQVEALYPVTIECITRKKGDFIGL